jgi:hypothetical protein
MAGGVIAAESRRIEPRRHASVEKERIPAVEDASYAIGDIENTIRLFEKVRYRARGTGERNGIGSRQFPAILDMETDRLEIVLVHTAIHGKLQRLALALKVTG